MDSNGRILGVFWAPMFEGALMCPPKDVGPYYEAYRAFQQLIEDSQFAKDHTVLTKLKPGQCVIFNNRRMLHGRKVKIDKIWSMTSVCCFIRNVVLQLET